LKRYLVVAVAVSLALVSGCSSDDKKSETSDAPSAGSITVFAAASLKKTFTDLGEQLKAENKGAEVTFSFLGSSDLAAQIIQGAPADVFASADTANMKKVTDAGEAENPVNFATNTLTIVTAPGNPKHISSFADLAQAGNQVVLCAPQVPCGSAAKKVEEATGTDIRPVSEESSVTDVLNKVTSGQADAGLVYVTDAAGAGDKVTAVAFPEAAKAVNTYPIATLKNAHNATLAQKFVALVTGQKGKDVLTKAGFGAP
jgi:molybdate transport system substrate-binding protein